MATTSLSSLPARGRGSLPELPVDERCLIVARRYGLGPLLDQAAHEQDDPLPQQPQEKQPTETTPCTKFRLCIIAVILIVLTLFAYSTPSTPTQNLPGFTHRFFDNLTNAKTDFAFASTKITLDLLEPESNTPQLSDYASNLTDGLASIKNIKTTMHMHILFHLPYLTLDVNHSPNHVPCTQVKISRLVVEALQAQELARLARRRELMDAHNKISLAVDEQLRDAKHVLKSLTLTSQSVRAIGIDHATSQISTLKQIEKSLESGGKTLAGVHDADKRFWQSISRILNDTLQAFEVSIPTSSDLLVRFLPSMARCQVQLNLHDSLRSKLGDLYTAFGADPDQFQRFWEPLSDRVRGNSLPMRIMSQMDSLALIPCRLLSSRLWSWWSSSPLQLWLTFIKNLAVIGFRLGSLQGKLTIAVGRYITDVVRGDMLVRLAARRQNGD